MRTLSPRSVLMTLCSFVLGIGLCAPTALTAQAYFGTVSGVLTDGTGAVVVDAGVVLTDVQKGYNFKTTSDANGRYLFRSIPPGTYTVTVDAKGFQKTASVRFKVDINQNATTDMTLKVAGASQTVEVAAEAATIQTQDAETGQVVNRRFINELPLIDRNAMDLVSLAPGVTEMDDQCQGCGGTNFVSNGGRGATADILTDGASVTNSEPNGGVTQATYVPSPEAIEEFKVEQTNFSAEYGFSGGSIVNMITRSGSNKFHGSVYDFLRDQITDANSWFNDYYGAPLPALRRNNYGATIGGPILKNKTFFFIDFDGYAAKTLGSAQAGVPSTNMRAGDFGEVCGQWGGTFDSTGRCSVDQGQLWDPYQRAYDSGVGAVTRGAPSTFIPYNNLASYISPGCNPAFLAINPGQTCPPGANEPTPGVPGNLIDPVALRMMSYFPKPNIKSSNGIYENWYGSGANLGYNNQFDIKIDHRFSASNLMAVKYSQQWSHGTGFNCFHNFTDPCQGGPNLTTSHLFAINDTHTFTPTLLLNTTLGFTRGAWHIDAYNPQGVNDPLGTLGFPSYLYSNGFKGVPPIFIGGSYYSAGFTSQGTDPYGNYRLGQDVGQLSITLDKVHGPHEIKFGFDGRIHQMNYIQTNAPLGYFSFDTGGSGACPGQGDPNYGQTSLAYCGGDGMASFLTGTMNGNSYYEIQFRPATQNFQFGWFAQDNWKATPKLTLNLGLRFDVTKPRTERHNRMDWFNPNLANPLNNGGISFADPVTGATDNVALRGGEIFATPSQRTIYVTDWTDIQPRFGFAYQFQPKWVMRGGFGIYYGQSRSGVTGVMPYGGQGFNQYTNVIPTYQNNGATPWLHLSNPFPNGLNQPPGSSLGLLNDVGYSANGPLRTAGANVTPNETSWSLGFERELPSHVLINAEYIGKKGTHLPFSASNYINHLGSWIEHVPTTSPDPNNACATLNVSCVNSYVNNPFASLIADPNSSIGVNSPQVQYSQLLVPYPQYTGVTIEPQMIASSIYHGLQLSAEKSYSNGLQFLLTFTWSKAIDDASQADDNVTWLGSFSSLQNPNQPWAERSLSTFDIPYVVQFSYTYDLPIGKGKPLLGNIPSWADAIIGGWKTNGIWRISDGRPMTFFLADGVALPTYGGQRPNLVGRPRRNHAAGWQFNYFADNSVFQRTPDFTLGNAPRAYGGVRTPVSLVNDLSVSKQFAIREQMNVEVRLESQNALNHPVFGTPNTSVDDPSFGTIGYTSIGPRELQLAIKFNF